MPRRWASAGPVISTGLPSQATVPPVSAVCAPAMTLTRVDLPAPLSPSSATTSPCWTWRPTASRARTAPKVLEIPDSSRTGVLMGWSLPCPRTGPGAHRGRAGAGPPGRKVPAGPDSEGFLAVVGVGVLALTDLLDGVDAVGDHGVVDLVDGEGDRFEQHRFDLLTAAVLELGEGVLTGIDVGAGGQVHGDLGGQFRLGTDLLVDGHVLLTGDDALDAGEFGVLPGDGRQVLGGNAGALESGDDTGGHTVVGGQDPDDLVRAQGGDGTLHLCGGLLGGPVGGVVLLTDLDLAVED